MRTQSLLKELRSYFIPRDPRVWGVATGSLAVGMSFILSTGSQVQTFIVSLINSDAVTIYGSAYQDSLVRFPSLPEWLLEGLHWLPLAMGAVISIFSLRRLTARQVLTSAIVSSFTVLTTVDLATALINNKLTINLVTENISANLFGSIAISIMTIAILIGCDFCFNNAPGHRVLRRAFAAAFAIIGGVFGSTCIYIGADLFYKPLSVKLDVLLDHPVSGVFATKPKEKSENAKNSLHDGTPPFELVPGNVRGGTARWTSPHGMLKAQWGALGTPIFDATIELYAGCMKGAELTNAANSARPFTLDDVKTLNVWFDQGMSEFSTESEESSGRLKLDINPPSAYWIDRDEGSKTVKLTQFVDEDATLRYWVTSGSTAFYVYAPLLNTVGGAAAVSARTLHIQANQKDYSINLEAPRQKSHSDIIECTGLAAGEVFKKGNLDSSESSPVMGALVRIHSRSTADRLYGRKDSELRVSCGSGWVTVSGLSEDALAKAKPGWVSMLEFKGNVANLEIDGSPTTTHPFASYFALGQLRGTFEKAGQLRFLGSAKALLKDGSRMNPTKWEMLSWEPRLSLLGVFGSLVAMTIKSIATRLRKDSLVHWLSS